MAKRPYTPETWWTDVLKNDKYKNKSDALKALAHLKKTWKKGDIARAEKLIDIFFRDPTKAPETFYDSTRVAAARASKMMKGAIASVPAMPVVAPSEDLQEIAALRAVIEARTMILASLRDTRMVDSVGQVDTSEIQSVVNDLVLDNERLTVLLRKHGVVVPEPAGRRTPVTSAAPAPLPPPEQPPEEENGQEQAPVEAPKSTSKRTPKGFAGYTAPTAQQREVFARTRPSQPPPDKN